MIVWCEVCKTNAVDVLPDDALHESFEGEACEVCVAIDIAFDSSIETIAALLGLPTPLIITKRFQIEPVHTYTEKFGG